MQQAAQLDSDGLFPWRYFVRVLAAAFQLRVLLLAVVGVSLTSFGVGHAFALFDGWGIPDVLLARVAAPLRTWASLVGVLIDRQNSFATTAATFVWRLAVWTLVGGAIARTVAARLSHRDPGDLSQTLRHAATRWHVGVAPVVVGLLLCGALLLPLWLHGLLMHVALLDLVSAVLLPIPLLLALGAAVVLVVLAIGWPLVIAGAAVERPDPFDMASAAFAYVTQRPVQLAAFLITALLVVTPVGVLVQAVGRSLGWLLAATLESSAGGLLESNSTAPRIALFWAECFVVGLPRVFYAAYFWSAAIAVYLLLRREIDGRQVDETEAP